MSFYTHLVYIHGFGSNSKTEKAMEFKKVAETAGLEFLGVEYDASTMTYNEIVARIKAATQEFNCIFVGTSLGGALAIACAKGADLVLTMNPSIHPGFTLSKYETMTDSLVSTWPLALLAHVVRAKVEILFYFSDDEVLDSNENMNVVKAYAETCNVPWDVKYLVGGSHRFDKPEHLAEVYMMINKVANQVI